MVKLFLYGHQSHLFTIISLATIFSEVLPCNDAILELLEDKKPQPAGWARVTVELQLPVTLEIGVRTPN